MATTTPQRSILPSLSTIPLQKPTQLKMHTSLFLSFSSSHFSKIELAIHNDELAQAAIGADSQAGVAPPAPKDPSLPAPPVDAFFLSNKLYSVISSKSLGGFELVLLHSPWHGTSDCWTGTHD